MATIIFFRGTFPLWLYLCFLQWFDCNGGLVFWYEYGIYGTQGGTHRGIYLPWFFSCCQPSGHRFYWFHWYTYRDLRPFPSRSRYYVLYVSFFYQYGWRWSAFPVVLLTREFLLRLLQSDSSSHAASAPSFPSTVCTPPPPSTSVLTSFVKFIWELHERHPHHHGWGTVKLIYYWYS